MNAYLVVLRFPLDDLPLFLTDDEAKAREFAKDVVPEDGEDEKRILSLDTSEPCNVSIWRFEDGRLVESELVTDFTC
jgi:hypothetical protein